MQSRVFKVIAILLVVLLVSISMTGCYGKFQLTKKVYNWNGQVGDKFVNSIVMWILYFVPVYGIAGFLDVAVLNVIEFWTGTNPIALGPDESETQVVQMNGKDYEIKALQNRFEIRDLGDLSKGTVSLVYDEKEKAWFIESEESGKIKIAVLDENQNQLLHLIDPQGHTITVDLEQDAIME